MSNTLKLLTVTALIATSSGTILQAAENGSRLDRIEDRIDRRESRLDRQTNNGPRDRIEDRIDRIEDRRDLAGKPVPKFVNRWERRSWRRTFANN